MAIVTLIYDLPLLMSKRITMHDDMLIISLCATILYMHKVKDS